MGRVLSTGFGKATLVAAAKAGLVASLALVWTRPGPLPPDRWLVPVDYQASTALRTFDRRAFHEAGVIARDFAPPAQNWLPGHRGIDLVPNGSAAFVAPFAARIGFAGKVAGKPVVTLLHSNGLRSTFEPAETELAVGTFVDAGDHVGFISSAGPWHCATLCLHWGVKEDEEYLDPWQMIRPQVRIILLPLPGAHALG